MNRLPLLAIVLSFAAACTTESSPPEAPGFDPGPVPEGYTRFLTGPVDIAPGEEVVLDVWVADPATADMDVVDFRGGQSREGHHVVLYSTTDVEPVGTTRAPVNADQINQQVLATVGGEVGATFKPPPGVVFRLGKGRAILANVHYLNTSAERAVGWSFVDVKLVAASPEHQVAARYANADLTFSVPPHQEKTLDVSCVMQHDVSLFAWTNHMHEHGVSIFSEVQRKGGEQVLLKRDDTWQPQWVNDPSYVRWPLEAPLKLEAGDTVHTQCTWKNPSAAELAFPTEMCIGVGYFLGDHDVACANGTWVE